MRARVRSSFDTTGIPGFLAISVLCALLASAGCRGTDKASAPETARPVDTVQGPAGSLHVDDGGKGGLPVLFVHGLGGDSGVWEAQLRHLRASRRAVALDLRGHGRSAAPKDGDYAVASVAQDVAAVADALGLKRFVLVGHSWGGLIVCAYVGKHSDRVAGLLFADPAGDLSSLSAKEKDGFRAELSKGDPKANVEGFFSAMLAPAAPGVKDRVMATVRTHPASIYLSAWEGMFAYAPGPDLKRFGGPMLTVITPQNKEPYSLQNVDKRIAVEEMSGVSHWLMMDKPDAFCAILDGFLPRCEASVP